MARSKTPDEQIRSLEAERLRIAVDKDATSRAVSEAKEVLGTDGPRSVTNRQRAALQGQARGREHEPFGAIAQDAADAQAAILANQVKVEALDRAIKEVAREIEEVEDGALEFFSQQAHEASLAAVEAQATAREALTAAYEAWRAADSAWGRIRAARRRLDWPPTPACPLTDLASVVSGFESATRQVPWPGGRRPERDEQIKVAAEQVDWPVRWDGVGVPATRAPRLSNAEALLRFGGEAA
jgi:hypothetical protein